MAPAPAPRPAQGFGTARAQRWILASALIVAMIYALRRLVEDDPEPHGSRAAKIAGAGSPPPSLAHWAIAYGTGFTILALVSLPAPELAGSIALLVVAGATLANGNAVAADITGLSANGDGKPNLETADQANARIKANLAAGRPPLTGMPGYHPPTNLPTGAVTYGGRT